MEYEEINGSRQENRTETSIFCMGQKNFMVYYYFNISSLCILFLIFSNVAMLRLSYFIHDSDKSVVSSE